MVLLHSNTLPFGLSINICFMFLFYYYFILFYFSFNGEGIVGTWRDFFLLLNLMELSLKYGKHSTKTLNLAI